MKTLAVILALVVKASNALPQDRDTGSEVSAYTSVELRPWLSIEIPSNWRIQSEEMTGTVSALMEAQGLDATEALQSFSAFLVLPEIGRSPARMNVRFYPDHQMPSNDELNQLNPSDIEFFDNQIRSGIEEGMQRIDGRLTAWHGSELVQVNGRNFIVTSYQRDLTSNPLGNISNVYLHRYIDGERSFTLTTSCRADFCSFGQPIIQHIQYSISFN